jgi:hypothetical protein
MGFSGDDFSESPSAAAVMSIKLLLSKAFSQKFSYRNLPVFNAGI